LLESARGDRAPVGAEERALAALTASAAVGIAVVATHGASTPPAALASKVASAVVVKWLGLGIAVTVAIAVPVTYLVVSGGGASAVVAPAPLPSVAATKAPTSKAEAPPAEVQSEEREPDGDGERPDLNATPSTPPPPAPLPSAAPRASSAAAARKIAAPARSTSSLSPELDVLDRARSALATHDPAAARRALDEYRILFPQGSLREEAELASIEVLVQTGDTTGVREAALAFLAAHPASTYVGRVRSILKRASNLR
jgi:hypothetical protein